MDDDRLKHSLAVANKMVEIGKERQLDENQLRELFLLGFVHDIGYQFDNSDNHDEHSFFGGNILKENGYKYWKEVYYHGHPDVEYESVYLDILNEADMSVDKYGNDVGFEKRLEDIKSRYGKEAKAYKNSVKIIEKIKSKRSE